MGELANKITAQLNNKRDQCETQDPVFSKVEAECLKFHGLDHTPMNGHHGKFGIADIKFKFTGTFEVVVRNCQGKVSSDGTEWIYTPPGQWPYEVVNSDQAKDAAIKAVRRHILGGNP